MLHAACNMQTIVCILHAIVRTLHAYDGVQPAYTIACMLHSASICISSVISKIRNAGLNSGVDHCITGFDALHTGFIAGVYAVGNKQ
jgi:hypothetical protein